MTFALQAPWPGNFRDLAAAVLRLATLAEGGRINAQDVMFETEQLRRQWGKSAPGRSFNEERVYEVLGERVESLDRVDLVALVEVLKVIGETGSMAEAGRVLFAQSRAQKANPNDTDRIRKWLLRYDLSYASVKAILNG